MENSVAVDIKLKEIKILAVDDREDNLVSIESILERDNYTIVKANSGRAALKILLQEHDFTLILMDVQMPDMNGFETAALIYEREKLRHIPIIFITAHDYGDENMFRGYETGGVDYIYKPINSELLRYKVSVFAQLFRSNHRLITQEKVLKEMNRDLQNEIEERKIVQEKINKLNKQLVANNQQLKIANEELDRFAYVASHDLQEPLRKIRVFGDKLSNLQPPTSETEWGNYLAKILKSSERMQQLINDLLQFSRHTNDNYGFEKTDFNSIVREVISDLDAEIQQKNAQVLVDAMPVCWAVPTQIYQLFKNIISNSLKFSRPSVPPVVHIQTRELAPDSYEQVNSIHTEKYFRISISDNGIGFDQKYSDDIFKLFKRLHSYHEFEGTGIGLSICKKIVEKHHGHIDVKSGENEGATFIITLPEISGVLVEEGV